MKRGECERENMTLVVRCPSVIVTAVALVPRCLPLLLVLLFGTGAPAVSQEREPRSFRDLQAAPEPRRDILILRSGGYEQGALAGCSDQSCSLDGKSHPRDDIVLIGLGIGSSDPAPAIDDPLQDSIHLRSAAVLKAKLLGINTQMVVSGQGAKARGEVAWIYLAPPQPARPDHAGRPINPAAPGSQASKIDKDPPPPPPAGETRQPAPPSGPGYRSPAAAPASGESPSYIWEGQIEVENVFAGRTIAMDVHGRHKWRGVYQVRFLEKWSEDASSVTGLSGQSFRVNEIVPLEMNYTIQADHHHDYDNRWGDVVLRGAAAGKLAGNRLRDAFVGDALRFDGSASASNSTRSAPPRSFGSWQEFHDFVGRFQTDRRPGCFQLSIAFGGRGQPPQELRALYQGIGRSGSSPIHPDPDADFLRVMPSHMPDGTNVYDCLDGPEQREVMGEYTYPYPDPGPLDHAAQITIRWSFTRCPQGATCARPRVSEASGPPSQPDLCPEPKIQTALLRRGLDEQSRIKERLDRQRRAYDALVRQAEQWKNDFTHASRDCSLWSAALTLTGFLAGRGPTTKAGNPGEAFNNFLNLIDKVSVGDPSWMLPDVESDMLPSVETAWDAFRAGYDALGPAAPEKMLYDLRMCGAPTIDSVMDGAIKYVRLLQQIEPMMQDVRKTLNDLRAKDNELLNLWSDYHRACLAYAKCKKLPPNMCDRVPAAR